MMCQERRYRYHSGRFGRAAGAVLAIVCWYVVTTSGLALELHLCMAGDEHKGEHDGHDCSICDGILAVAKYCVEPMIHGISGQAECSYLAPCFKRVAVERFNGQCISARGPPAICM